MPDAMKLRVLILLFVSTRALALEPASRPAPCPNPGVEELRVQMQSSSTEIPNPLRRPKVVRQIGCDRPFSYRGDVYNVDSPQAQDASNLRTFAQSVPESDELLNSYQRRRELSKLSAYTGTIGILALAFGPRIARSVAPDSQASLKSILQISGLALTIGGFAYSFAILRTNESLIPRAVNAYNQAKPEDPIELKFETGWSF
jgi:hypothetical protein